MRRDNRRNRGNDDDSKSHERKMVIVGPSFNSNSSFKFFQFLFNSIESRLGLSLLPQSRYQNLIEQWLIGNAVLPRFFSQKNQSVLIYMNGNLNRPRFFQPLTGCSSPDPVDNYTI